MIRCPNCQHEFTNAPSLDMDGTKGRRGMRLPDDFNVPDDWMRWARQKRPGVDATLQAQLFVNYWTAKTGADAAKKDWFRTWQNWILQCRLDPKSVPVPAPRVNPSPAAQEPRRAPRKVETEEDRAAGARRLADVVAAVPWLK